MSMFDGKLPPSLQVVFLKRLRFLLSQDGMVLSKALLKIAEAEAGKISTEAEFISSELESNETLYDSMIHFDDRVRGVMAVNHQVNKLEDGVAISLEFMSREVKSSSGLMFMLAMPFFVVVVELFILSIIATSVLPEFESLIPRAKWPAMTLFVSSLGQWIHRYWFILPLVFVTYPVVFGYYKSRLVGDVRNFCDKYLGLLGFGLYREATASQFLTMIGHLMQGNNFVLAKALAIIIEQSSEYLKWHASMMLDAIGNETDDPDLASAMDTGLLNDDDLANIRIAAEGKDMAYSIGMVAEEKIDAIGDKIKRTQLFAQIAVAIITSTLSLLIVFSVAPLALNMQAAFKH